MKRISNALIASLVACLILLTCPLFSQENFGSVMCLQNGTVAISGSVLSEGLPLAGVKVMVGDSVATTDKYGGFTLNSTYKKGVIKIHPELSGYVFRPSNIVINEGKGPAPAITFEALPTYVVSGDIVCTGYSGDYGAGATITAYDAAGSGESYVATTNCGDAGVGCTYSFNLPNGTYYIQGCLGQWTGGGISSTVTVSGQNILYGPTIEFVYQSSGSFSVSGRVTLGAASLKGVKLTGTNYGINPYHQAITDISGSYQLCDYAQTDTVTVKPSKEGYNFIPSEATVSFASGISQVVDFSAVPTYCISGFITYNGSGLAGVSVSANGSTPVQTDGTGAFSICGLQNGSYTVTPTLSGYIFSPSTQSVSVNGADVKGVNFTAAQIHNISGTVTYNGVGLSGVKIKANGSNAATTGNSGTYAIVGLEDGPYTIAPSLTGYTFTPTSRAITLSGQDASGVDFAAQLNSTQLLLNPGFEQGNNGDWTVNIVAGTSHKIITTSTAWYSPHSGSYQASLCGLNGKYYKSSKNVVKQTVSLPPSGFTSATLTFWVAIPSATTGSKAHDLLKVQILNTAGTVLSTPLELSNLDQGGWKEYTVDLTSYLGKTVQVKFKGVTTSTTKGTAFLIDDTALNIQ